MKLESILKRLRQKTDCKTLLRNKNRLPDRCLPWKGSTTNSKPGVRMRRDGDFLPYQAAAYPRPLAKIVYQGKTHLVHRLLHELVNKPETPYRAKQICGTQLCVNPNHWVFTSYYEEPEEAFPDEPPPQGEWTLEEAQEMVDSYLFRFPIFPADLENDFLIDIPPFCSPRPSPWRTRNILYLDERIDFPTQACGKLLDTSLISIRDWLAMELVIARSD